MEHVQSTGGGCSPGVAGEINPIIAKPALRLRLDELLTVQLQVGQVVDNETWVSCAPEFGAIGHGDTQESSMTNLYRTVEDVCEFLPSAGGPLLFQADVAEDDLRPFPHRKTIIVRESNCVQLRASGALFTASPSCQTLG